MSDNGRLVFVTGGGRGIGKAIVEGLAASGCSVTFTYRNAAHEAQTLCSSLQQSYPALKFSAVRADLSRKGDVEGLALEFSNWSNLYGFVHNSGAAYDALAATIDQSNAEEIMQVNFWSMTRLIKAALRPMMRAKAGRIVGIGSITTHQGAQGNASYAATKGAMTSYMKSLSVEVARKGVTCNVISPGYIDTDMLAPYEAGRSQIEKQIPCARFGRADEIASLVCFLLGTSSAFITGAEIPIDGGLSASTGIKNS
ncbi:MAG: SDR family NAD(P)-dependent oxidoreductase [Hyphomicrobiaceae bacterium]